MELVGTPPKTELIKIEIKGAICHHKSCKV